MTICMCGMAKSYHPRPDHLYQPRYAKPPLLPDDDTAVERLAAALLDAVGGDDPRHDDPWSQNFAKRVLAALAAAREAS